MDGSSSVGKAPFRYKMTHFQAKRTRAKSTLKVRSCQRQHWIYRLRNRRQTASTALFTPSFFFLKNSAVENFVSFFDFQPF